MLKTHKPTKIATLNDAARKSFSGCRVYMTPGVQALYQTQAIAGRVQAYDDFTERNDPYGEHDFGSFHDDVITKAFLAYTILQLLFHGCSTQRSHICNPFGDNRQAVLLSKAIV